MTDNCRSPLHVMHLGAGVYPSDRRDHSTFGIWRNLAAGFRRYTVVGRARDGRGVTLRDGNLAVALIPSRFESEAEFLMTQAAAIRLGRRLKPDVVISQCPALGGLAACGIGAPMLFELHGFHYFRAGGSAGERLVRAIARRTLPRATRIRVLSSGMKASLLERFGAGLADRTVVLPPRVDLSVFGSVKQDWRIEGRRPRAVMVGALNDNKGQARFMRAVLGAGLDIDIWLVGEGADADACREVAKAHGAEDRVRLFGRLTHAELADLLPQADVLVQYSRTEGTPRAVLEGMAVGLPVITTRAGFVDDILEHDRQGLVLGPEPDAETPRALAALFADEERRAAYGRSGRRRVEAEFDSRALFSRYRALIRETAEA